MTRPLPLGLLATTLLLSSACTLGPTAVRPPSAVGDAAAFANARPQGAAAASLERWWTRLGDPGLEADVAEALEKNSDLRAAAARVLEARALLGIARGARLPRVDASLQGDRSQRTFDFSGERFSVTSTTYTFQGTARWQLDLFGKLRRQQEAEWYRLLASEASHDALLHSIVSEIVRARAELASLARRLELAQARTESFERTLALVESRFESDLADALQVEAARESLAQSRALEPELAYRVAAARHALDVLRGRRPGAGTPTEPTLTALPPSGAPPTGVPAALLDRRPDLRATELASRARQAEIGVAIADLYPDLTISASGGYQSSSLGDLIDPASEIWSLVGSAAGKIFRGGALRAGVDAAEARAAAAAAEYASAVLAALREVEDALVRETTTWERYGHLETRVESAREAERYAQIRYDAGLESLLDVLEQTRRRYDAEDELLQLQQDLWDARIGLILALGGDWVASPSTDAARLDAPRATVTP